MYRINPTRELVHMRLPRPAVMLQTVIWSSVWWPPTGTVGTWWYHLCLQWMFGCLSMDKQTRITIGQNRRVKVSWTSNGVNINVFLFHCLSFLMLDFSDFPPG